MRRKRPPSEIQDGENMDDTQWRGDDTVGDVCRLFAWGRKLPYGVCFPWRTGSASYSGRTGMVPCSGDNASW